MTPYQMRKARRQLASHNANTLIKEITSRMFEWFVTQAKTESMLYSVKQEVSWTASDVVILVVRHFRIKQRWCIEFQGNTYTISYPC